MEKELIYIVTREYKDIPECTTRKIFKDHEKASAYFYTSVSLMIDKITLENEEYNNDDTRHYIKSNCNENDDNTYSITIDNYVVSLISAEVNE